MVGIYIGGTLVKDVYLGPDKLKEVYVGSTKVWPNLPVYPWTELSGIRALAALDPNATLEYASGTGLTASNGTGNALLVTNDAGILAPMGSTNPVTTGYVQAGLTLRPSGPSAVEAEPYRGTSTQPADRIFVKVNVELSTGDYVDGVFFRISSAGVLNFTTDPQLTAAQINTGIYSVTLPAGKRLAATSSIILTQSGTGTVIPMVSAINGSRNSFTITARNTAGVDVNTSIAGYIAMIPL
jgi:hypothetical protein